MDLKARKVQEREIAAAALALLQRDGPPPPSYRDIATEGQLSRQLVRYYYSDPEMLMVAVCDLLGEAYGTHLIRGVSRLEGPLRLEYFFDFYFDFIEDNRKPRDDRAYDAMFALAAGSDAVRARLRAQYTLLGQVLRHELKLQYPDLSLGDCAEIAYLFVCLMYGHWKMVASLDLIEEHRVITRRAIDRIIASYRDRTHPPLGSLSVWDAKS